MGAGRGAPNAVASAQVQQTAMVAPERAAVLGGAENNHRKPKNNDPKRKGEAQARRER